MTQNKIILLTICAVLLLSVNFGFSNEYDQFEGEYWPFKELRGLSYLSINIHGNEHLSRDGFREVTGIILSNTDLKVGTKEDEKQGILLVSIEKEERCYRVSFILRQKAYLVRDPSSSYWLDVWQKSIKTYKSEILLTIESLARQLGKDIRKGTKPDTSYFKG